MQLLKRYNKTRNKTVSITQPLATEDYVVQPIEDVSPPKWHLGHTTWFFETFILQKFLSGYKVFHKDFAFIFNSYYISMGEMVVRIGRGTLSRPTVTEIMEYRNYVDKHMATVLETQADDEIVALCELGINHEQQHQELLLTDIKYILANNINPPIYCHVQPNISDGISAFNWLEMDAGFYDIGHAGKGFGYDNEFPQHKQYIEKFKVANRPVSNADFLAFIEDGGYQKPGYWLSDGWAWLKANQIEHPLYWSQKKDGWHYFTLHGLRPLDYNVPLAHVSYYEADAFARWKGLRLPTEFEWEAAVNHFSNQQDTLKPEQVYMPGIENQSNLLKTGQVWEWTSSAYLPYRGYNQPKGAVGEYNGKFMINQMVLRGGSCYTPVGHARPTYRNFFHPPKQWQLTGFRLAADG